MQIYIYNTYIIIVKNKKNLMERTKKIKTSKSSQILCLLCLLMPMTIAESLDSDIVVFPSKDSKWKGKVEQVRKILVDSKTKKLYFAATNKIFSISSDLKSKIQEVEWNASKTSKTSCKKRENEDKCENFITILEFDLKNDLFTCGTNALKPTCVTLKGDTLKKPDKVIDGYRQHSPRTSDGTVVTLFLAPYLFIGMRANQEQGKLFKLKPYAKDILATTKESKIFDGFRPDFISAYSYDNYAYFFLREYGYESQKRKVRYSRVARVCKHDSGVYKYGLNKFVTLLRTRLQCNQKTNGLTDLFYDQLQSTFELKKNPAISKDENTFIYGVFSIANDLKLGSAICRYQMKEIQQVFSTSSLFRKEKSGEMKTVPFSTLRTKITRSACNSSSAIDLDMKELKQLGGIGPQLLYDDVMPHDTQALISVPGVSFTSIVVDEIKVKDNTYNIIFAGTTEGYVYKILVGNDAKGRILGEPFQPFKNSKSITSLRKMDNMIYVGSFDGIAIFRVDRCDAYTSLRCEDCIRDPYCHWSISKNKCANVNAVSSDGRLTDVEREIERVCPKTTVTVATSSVAPSSTITLQVTNFEVTATEALVPSTSRPHSNNGTTASISVVTTQASNTSKTKSAPTNDPAIKSGASNAGGSKSYYTEFIIMTILFVLVLILAVVLLKITKSGHHRRDSIDSTETKKGCHKFCPSSFSKAYMINRDHSNKKLMKENPVYKDTTVELNDVSLNSRHNLKVS